MNRLLFLALLAASPYVPALAAQSKCMSADSVSDHIINVMQNVDTVSDAGGTRLRQSLGLSMVPANQVTLVTTAATCTKGVQALDKLSGTPNPNRKVYVIKIGSMFVVVDGTTFNAPGEKVVEIFTSTFAYKSTMRF